MTNGDDLFRKRIDAILRDVREQHDHALSVLADTLVHTLAEHDANIRQEVEAELDAHTQTRVDAVQSAATSRLAQVEADAAAKLTALREQATSDLDRARAEAAADIARAGADAAARVAAAEKRTGDIERDRDERIAEIEMECATRIAEAERDRAARIAELEAAQATASGPPGAAAADLARLERLLDGVRALDAARTLSDVLEAVAVHAAREARRVAVLLVRADRLQGWRAIGFESAGVRDAATIDVDVKEGGIVTRAARTGRRAATSDRDAMPAAVATWSPPSFALLPGDRVGLAVPIAVGGHVVAVLYADEGRDEAAAGGADGWPEAVEMLARHAARCLEALTAAKAVAARRASPRPAASAARDVAESPDDAAKRYAKLLVSEIKLYHQPAVDAGRRASDLSERLAPEIARARSLYEERIGPDVRSRTDYFNQELVRTLADGNATLLGER